MKGPATRKTHLRVQLTLLAVRGSRLQAGRSGAFSSSLRVGTRNFACEVYPEHTLTPGAAAVHCAVAFEDPEGALPHFPPGTTIELWEGRRAGYGMVLAVR